MNRLGIVLVLCPILVLSVPNSDLLGQTPNIPSLYVLDQAASKIHVVTRRSGVLAFLGHDHAILATEWSGTLCWEREAPLSGRGQIVVAANGLVIDSPEGRALAGLGGGPGIDQVRKLQEKLLNTQHIAAAQYPDITLEVVRVSQSQGTRLDLEGQLTLRDRVRTVHFPVELTEESHGMRIRGVLNVRQSDFGIRPESIAGVVRVADPVEIHFDLFALPSGSPCRS